MVPIRMSQGRQMVRKVVDLHGKTAEEATGLLQAMAVKGWKVTALGGGMAAMEREEYIMGPWQCNCGGEPRYAMDCPDHKDMDRQDTEGEWTGR